jgi:hypothetical protein
MRAAPERRSPRRVPSGGTRATPLWSDTVACTSSATSSWTSRASGPCGRLASSARRFLAPGFAQALKTIALMVPHNPPNEPKVWATAVGWSPQWTVAVPGTSDCPTPGRSSARWCRSATRPRSERRSEGRPRRLAAGTVSPTIQRRSASPTPRRSSLRRRCRAGPVGRVGRAVAWPLLRDASSRPDSHRC